MTDSDDSIKLDQARRAELAAALGAPAREVPEWAVLVDLAADQRRALASRRTLHLNALRDLRTALDRLAAGSAAAPTAVSTTPAGGQLDAHTHATTTADSTAPTDSGDALDSAGDDRDGEAQWLAPAWDPLWPMAGDVNEQLDPTELWMRAALGKDVDQSRRALLDARAGNWDSEQVQVWLACAREHAVDAAALAVAHAGGTEAEVAAERQRMTTEAAGRDQLAVLTDYVGHLEDQAAREGVELGQSLAHPDVDHDARFDGIANGEDDPSGQ